MQIRPRLAVAVAIVAITFGANAQSAPGSPTGFRQEFLGQFNSSMSKFIALAEAMPADKYAWSPGPGVMSVAKVYAHVAHYNYRYPSTAMQIALPAGIGLDTLEGVAAKAAVVALLRRSGEHVKQAVEQMPESQLGAQTQLYGRSVQQWTVLLQLLAHMNEHLGQSIAYARMNGVVPPWSG
jgi:uncharacterized damage-inducible protein DinB